VRTVFVDKFPPLPADDGGKLRSAAILRRLAARGEVVVCAFERAGVPLGPTPDGVEVRTVPLSRSPRSVARGIARTRSGSAARFWDPALARLVTDALDEAPTDLLQVEHGQLAPYLGLGRARRRVLDLHNIDSALAASYARSTRSPRGRLAGVESRLLRRLERRAVARADLVVTVSEDDARRLAPRPRELVVCPNGWDPGTPLPVAADPVVVFAALLSWQPNVDAAVWFARDVWPAVVEARPDARLLLVGRDPAPEVRALAGESVEVTGTVPDVRPYVAAARVAVAPLRAGGGTRLKILEALDAGRPVVATSVGVSGLDDLVGHGVVVADDPSRMAAEITALLADADRAARLGADGHAAVRARYSWDGVLAPLLDRVSA
jgi:polysaccharide biosynthesis protein PslH